jgi:NAD(P)-dependent dehydrogenase (short-subunit alcohol dehydrogenase family)
MIRNALHSHIVTARFAAPLMVERGSGLIVEIGDGDALYYRSTLFYDLIKVSVARFAYAMAEELHRHGVAAMAVTPGFMRTEWMLDHFGVTESNWREAGTKDPAILHSESPYFVGRAVAALAADPKLMDKSGGLYSSWNLAKEYGFRDVNGTQPDIGSYLNAHPEWHRPKTGVEWSITTR